MNNDAPNQKFILFRHTDGIKIVVGGHQPATVAVNFDAFNGELPVDKTDGDFSIGRFQAFVDNDQIPIVDTGIDHGISFHPGIEGRRGVFDQLLVEINGDIHKILCRRGKSGMDPRYDQRKLQYHTG